MSRLVVVGGGIAGLAGAYEARRAAAEAGLEIEVVVLEASDRAGGKILTETVDGVPLEWGPDSFLATKPETEALCRELGLELVEPGPAAARAYLWVGGRLRPFPDGLVLGVPSGIRPLAEAAASGVIGPTAALRAAVEPLLPRRVGRSNGADVDASSLVRSRLGRRVADRLVAPILEAVYGAPWGELSAQRTLAPLWEGRSLVRTAAKARRSRSEGPAFLTVRGGLGTLIDALVARLPDVRTGSPVEVIARRGAGWSLRTPGGEVDADAVLLAIPAPAAARLAPEPAGRLLGHIGYSSSAVVLLRFSQGSMGRPLDGSGYLAPPEERMLATACTWLSAKWPHLGETVWLRAFVTSPETLALPDDDLGRAVAGEVGAVMLAATPPEDVRVQRWDLALPVYRPGHAALVEALRAALPTGLAVAGASLEGVGLSDCIRTGREAVRALVAGPAAGKH